MGKETTKTKDEVPVKKRQTGKLTVYAYTIKDAAFGSFKVLNTSNAWWKDRLKVDKLIDAYKFECTDKEACYYAGISLAQLEYFLKLHPEFYGIKDACNQALGLFARQHFAKRVKAGDDVAVMTYLKKKHKAEFAGQMDVTSGGKPMGSNTIVFVDFGEPIEEPINMTSETKVIEPPKNATGK